MINFTYLSEKAKVTFGSLKAGDLFRDTTSDGLCGLFVKVDNSDFANGAIVIDPSPNGIPAGRFSSWSYEEEVVPVKDITVSTS